MKLTKFPSAQTILIVIAGLVTLLTWLIPAGQYDALSYDSKSNTFQIVSAAETLSQPATQETLDQLQIKIPITKFTNGDIYKPISIPHTYKSLSPHPQGIGDFAMSPIKGIIDAADIIFLVLIIGGLIGIMNATGAFDAGISWLSKALEGREYVLIILVTVAVAAGGTTFGFAEETMAFYPILIPVFIAAKYDAMVGLACIFLGSSVGGMCSTINPFSTIIASDASGINWTTGLAGRFGMLVICITLSILYILRYANRVKKDPTKSIIFDQKDAIESYFRINASAQTIKLTLRLRLILVTFTLCFVLMIIGVSSLGWWFTEMTTIFLVGAVLIAIIGKIKETLFIDAFSKGAGELLSVAFIIGIARGVSILMNEGLISDTILYFASDITNGMNKGVFINILFLIFNGLTFFISSSSGMAVLTMPIMSPLADSVGIGREAIVNAYQFGNGLFNIINPTGLVLASLAIVKIGYNKWLKFVMPLFFVLTLVTIVSLTISVYL